MLLHAAHCCARATFRHHAFQGTVQKVTLRGTISPSALHSGAYRLNPSSPALVHRAISSVGHTPVMLIKRDPDFPACVLPQKMTDGSVGFDLTCPKEVTIAVGGLEKIPLGFAMRPEAQTDVMSFYPQIKARSSFAAKGVDVLGGVIDRDSNGFLFVVMENRSQATVHIEVGERFAQTVFLQYCHGVQFHEVDELPVTERGEGGFGSTGRSSLSQVTSTQEASMLGREAPHPGEHIHARVAQLEARVQSISEGQKLTQDHLQAVSEATSAAVQNLRDLTEATSAAVYNLQVLAKNLEAQSATQVKHQELVDQRLEHLTSKVDAAIELQRGTAAAVAVAQSSLADQQQQTIKLKEELNELDWKFVEYLQHRRPKAVANLVRTRATFVETQLVDMYYGRRFVSWLKQQGLAWKNSDSAQQAVETGMAHIQRRRQGILIT